MVRSALLGLTLAAGCAAAAEVVTEPDGRRGAAAAGRGTSASALAASAAAASAAPGGRDGGAGEEAGAPGSGSARVGDAGPDGAGTSAAAGPRACPEEMVFVDTVFCPRAEQHCLHREGDNPNHLTICTRFAPGQTCRGEVRRQRFCIDRYEFPSERGGHPPVMVSAYDAAALCAERGKRMCWESEWTAACEGPEKLPFPYGHERSARHCNIDNMYVHPDLDKVHHPADRVRGPELLRLDQSVLSGTLETCKSGFGVYDLTGNFDEWVLTERIRGRSEWAGLKGGAWGHVRNACRPITTSHVSHWSYYFISFRCCRDPDPTALAALPTGASEPKPWSPPPAPTPPPPGGGKSSRGWTPPPGAVRPHAPLVPGG